MFWLSNVLTILIVVVGLAAIFLPWVIGYFVADDAGPVTALVSFIMSAAVLWLAVFGLVNWSIANLKSTEKTETFTVNKTERVTDSDGKSSRYLVYTNKGVFENTDEMYYWKFNSSDLYNQIQAGKTYTCKTVGWRIEFWSSYRNIISCEEVRQ